MIARVQPTRKIRPAYSILDAVHDPHLFQPWFKHPKSWEAWFVFLRAMFGLPMDDEQRAIFAKHTGRDYAPGAPFIEAWLIIGRRGGKSFVMALIGVFLACFRDYRQFLQPGERATVLIIAADRKQARVILRYVRGLLSGISMLKRMIIRETAEGFDLDNSVTIEIGVASFRTTRGYTFAAVLADEIAFWRTDEHSANPDTEIVNAIRPGLVTIPGAPLICASSPYARRGELWEAHRRYFGKADGPLVWQASTRDMNPNVRQAIIDEALERDQAAGAAEYLAQFRSDIESFISREIVDAAIIAGRHELPAAAATYCAFVDPSGGSADSFTLAIAHTEKEKGVLDLVREYRPPFSPDGVVQEMAAILRSYNVRTVTGDKYAGEWPRERFREHGVEYETSALPKSDIYREFLPILNAGRAELLDHPRMIAQLCGLERRTARSGKDSIDHAPGAHDDVVNAAAGAIVLACGAGNAMAIWEKLVA